MSLASFAAPIILVLVYGGVALGRIPGFRLDRAGIAFLGGAAMIVFGGVSLDEAFHAIDWDTIALLLGMMIVVAHLKVSGAFRALGALAVEHAHAPLALLIATTLLAGLLSAFLVNDAICLVMAPIVVGVTRALRRDPLPYLVATATASNCGSVATITGNPQNMVIGALSGISYPAFSAALAPVAAFGLVLVVVVVRLVYREEFARRVTLDPHVVRGRSHPGQMLKASLTCVALAIAFFAGVRPAEAAIVGGAFLLLTRSLKPARIYRELDGPLLILFAGLFVVVAGAERALLTPDVVASVQALGLADPWRLSALVGGAVEHRQQRAGGVGAEAVHPAARGRPSRLAGRRDELDAGRQFHPHRLGRQSHRRRAGARGGNADRLPRLFQGRPAADPHHARLRNRLARLD